MRNHCLFKKIIIKLSKLCILLKTMRYNYKIIITFLKNINLEKNQRILYISKIVRKCYNLIAFMLNLIWAQRWNQIYIYIYILGFDLSYNLLPNSF